MQKNFPRKNLLENFHQEISPNKVIYQRQVLPPRKPKLSANVILLHLLDDKLDFLFCFLCDCLGYL